MGYFLDNIEAMAPYVPGEQPPPGRRVVKLNTNENPYPPSPAVLDALRTFDGDPLRRYPDAMAGALRQAVSEVLDVPRDWILPGNGSDDLIMMIARACVAPHRSVVYPTPTFEFYHTQARIEDARCVEVPLQEDFSLPVDALIEASGDVTFVANPNSPTGLAAPVDALAALADGLSGLLVIDEAYVDFADGDALDLARRFENVVILRTLSKGYSLAGLRVGWAVARPGLLSGLLKTKAIYNVGALPCRLGTAAVRDQDYKNQCADRVRASRDRLAGELGELGFTVWPSQANFLMVRPGDGDAGRVAANLKERGVLVRYYDKPRLGDKLRITVGTEEENRALLDALAAARGGA